VTFSRAYYHCSRCRHGIVLWDQTLGLTKRKLTPAVEEILSLAGTVADFDTARRMVYKTSGLQTSESTVRRVTEGAGDRLAEAMDQGELFEPEETWDWSIDAQGKRCGYVGIDGVHVPMQGPNATHAETRVEYVGRLYNHRDVQGKNVSKPHDFQGETHRTRREIDSCYVAGMHSLDETCEHLRQHHNRVGGEQIEEMICITDGGAGIAAALERTFWWTTWILDFWHAKEYLVELAKTLHGGDDDSRQRWLDAWCHALKHEGGEVVLGRLQKLEQMGWSSATHEAWENVTRYFQNNWEGMDYPRYVKNGWQIGSGPTEAACKTVVSTRLKRSGMRWIAEGANSVSHLRALFLNGNAAWNNFWTSQPNQHQAL